MRTKLLILWMARWKRSRISRIRERRSR